MKPSHRKILAAVSYIGLFAACFMFGWWHESPDKRGMFHLWLILFSAHSAAVAYAIDYLRNPERTRAALLGLLATVATTTVGYFAGIGLRTLQH